VAERVGKADGRTTIFEVAHAAGVSITTVSHVFSGKRRVTEQTRRRVHEAAERLGYHPRLTAQALATGRTMTIALQLSTSLGEVVLNPWFSELLPAMSLAGVEHGYSFVFVPPDPPRPSAFDALIGDARVDGAVLIDPIDDDPFVQALQERRVPFASLGRLLHTPNEHWVDNDHRAICAGLVQHLRAAGYERLAFLSLPGTPISLLFDYVDEFARRAPEAPTYATRDYSWQAAFETALRVLSGPERPDALLTTDHRLALGVLEATRELGIAVPDELGVATVGGPGLAASTRPSLTSVNLFPARAGTLLIEMIDALLRGAPVETPVIVPSQLVPRESTLRR
jgi:DNA-binding LacI/PurR family transcriptional regulator